MPESQNARSKSLLLLDFIDIQAALPKELGQHLTMHNINGPEVAIEFKMSEFKYSANLYMNEERFFCVTSNEGIGLHSSLNKSVMLMQFVHIISEAHERLTTTIFN